MDKYILLQNLSEDEKEELKLLLNTTSKKVASNTLLDVEHNIYLEYCTLFFEFRASNDIRPYTLLMKEVSFKEFKKMF